MNKYKLTGIIYIHIGMREKERERERGTDRQRQRETMKPPKINPTIKPFLPHTTNPNQPCPTSHD